MATFVYDKAKEAMLGSGLSLSSAVIKAVLTDNTLYGVAISAASNASPIAITTSSPHGLSTGDHVFIFGMLGNTAANGRWTVTVTDSTHFTLNGSTGNGAYTSGGYMVDLSNKEFLSDIAAGARVAISPAFTTKTLTRGVFDADDVTFTGVAGAACQSINIFIDTGTPATSRLIACIASATGLPTGVNPGTVNVQWDSGADKIFAM